MNCEPLRMAAAERLIQSTTHHRQQLINELIDNGTDPTLRMRRYRMLAQLALFEQQSLEKISRFQSDDPADWATMTALLEDAMFVTSRSS